MLDLRADSSVEPVIISSMGREVAVLDDLVALVQLVRMLRRFRPDIVHTHLAKAGLLGRLAAFIVRTPIVVHTFHGNVLRGYFGSRVNRLLVFIERMLAVISARLIAISPRQHAEIRGFGIAREPKLIEIPLGLDLAPFVSPPVGRLRSELGLSSATRLVGTVARLVPIKAVDVFLEAAARLALVVPNVVFVVVGDGPDADVLTSQARRLGIADRVRFLGWRRDLPEIYADLDVVVLASHNEGTPVSVIEALAAARPVVATAVGGTPDVLGDSEHGLLVGDGDVDGIARAIAAQLADPSRAQGLAEAGREHVMKTYDASILLQRIDGLYMSLLGTIASPGRRNTP